MAEKSIGTRSIGTSGASRAGLHEHRALGKQPLPGSLPGVSHIDTLLSDDNGSLVAARKADDSPKRECTGKAGSGDESASGSGSKEGAGGSHEGARESEDGTGGSDPENRIQSIPKVQHERDLPDKKQYVSENSNLARISVNKLLCSDVATTGEPTPLGQGERLSVRERVMPNASSWTPEEDEQIINLVEKYGTRAWNILAHAYFKDTRTGAQLRSRYVDVINPNRRRGPWSKDDDRRLLELQQIHGNHWSRIARHFSGRVPNDIKNRFRDLKKAAVRIQAKSEAMEAEDAQ
eukprot:CAMPEP_0182446566 /NCGR_PEP_ID=MMETSP1172-20130603/4282_1 /TAXON_ID=708627 /ORGANISM="Timspurckia oligopyrenoides, Strain CCMP3278" /LENGTH=291 /DNA_ID=CAMNT_0024642517 /DNA_START=164 /DNA_END=1039 /DNA_ORIENTATION=+